MELDELKAGWSVLGERLQQQEIVNKRLLQEMIRNRTNSARSRLLQFDTWGIVAILMGIIGICLLYVSMRAAFALPFILLLEGILVYGLIMQLYISSFLFRFNTESKKLSELFSLALNYRLWVKRNSFISAAVVIISVPFLIYFQRGNLTSETWRYVMVVFCIISGVLISYFTYTYFYKPNIATIEKGLEELKEFEKE